MAFIKNMQLKGGQSRKATAGKNVILLMGSTGSGKTCFMHTLAGVGLSSFVNV